MAGVLGLVVLSFGCTHWHVPNPNDPADVGPLSPEVLRRNLDSVSGNLWEREIRGEITKAEYRTLVAKAANEMLSQVDSENIPPDKAWQYAALLQDARQWKLAEPIFRQAVKFAKASHNDDRWVNDSLRLATVLAEEGKVPEAIATARSVFGVPPTETAPILYGVSLDLAPVARGKGHDLELAQLIEDAIPIHKKTIVDLKSQAGRDFVVAIPRNVSLAYETAAELYDKAGRHDLADAAMKKAEATLDAIPRA